MSGSLQPIYANIAGKPFQVFKGSDNKFYLYDPHRTLNTAALQTAPHTYLPGAEDMVSSGMHGLGASAQQYTAAAGTALSFVPVVGPVLGPLVGAIGSLFGGGDPTPASSLWKAIIDAREAVAQTKNALAGSTVDTFVVPPGLDRTSDGKNGGNTGNVWASAICEEVLNGKPFNIQATNIHSVKRAQWYSTLQALQKQLTDLQQQQHDRQLTQSVISQVTGAQQPVSQVTTPALPQTTTPAVVSPAPVPVQPSYMLPNYQYTPQVMPQYQQSSMLPGLNLDINTMLPYLMLGGMLMIVMSSSSSSSGGKKNVSR